MSASAIDAVDQGNEANSGNEGCADYPKLARSEQDNVRMTITLR